MTTIKLMSIQACEEWLAQGSETEDGRITDTIVKQLLDIMRDNERLRKGLEQILQYEAYGCGCNSVAEDILNKESENE